MLTLATPIQYLTGVGPVMAKKLKRLGIETVRDLLFYFPRAWDDFSRPRPISSLRIGEETIIKAKILQIKQNRTRRKWMSIIEALLADDSGQIKAIWFNQSFLMKILKPKDEWLFAGKVAYDRNLKIKVLNVSQYEKEPIILPVYPETEGLTSKYLRKLIKPLLPQMGRLIEDYLPAEIIARENLIKLLPALKNIHFPDEPVTLEQAKKRLAFDELFLIALRMLNIKKDLSKITAPALKIDKELLRNYVEKLPFRLTNAQRKAAWEIICDLARRSPMNRLLEGDVGSGKTVVAAMAVLVAAKNNIQSVWLAPTEILANQHFKNVAELLKPFNITIGLLTSANKKTNLEKDDLIIGTHAILQKDVNFPRLGLIIIDEQHRFGVKQRAHLRKQSINSRQLTTSIIPHLLSMTATPIPRTLALALYGDLDISIIDEMPPGRQKVITKIISPQNRQKAYDFIRDQLKSGRQIFVICPLIENQNVKIKMPNDNPELKRAKLFDLDRKSVIDEYNKLSQKIFPDWKIGLLHGRLKSKEKEETMRKFHQGKLDILVSTAVVEVGIDVPNATVMMIEGADRFGLAQLHQFRGRVGRGKHQSYCFLFAQSWSENIRKRLQAMVSCHNGFELAEKDLEIRGPGELMGIRQSGLPDLKMASLSDIMLVKKARAAAEKIIEEGIEKYPKLAAKIEEFESERHLE
jgi:ATP-dependent DNA helicase RecG